MREIKEDINKLRDRSSSWIEKLSIVKVSALFKWSKDSRQSPNHSSLFCGHQQADAKIYMEMKKKKKTCRNEKESV